MIHLPEEPAPKLFKKNKPKQNKKRLLESADGKEENKNPLSKTKQDPCKPYHVPDHLIRKRCLPVQTNKLTNEIHPHLPQQVLLK